MKSTTDHDVIKTWVMKWGGTPAIGTNSMDGDGKGILRINFGKRAGGEPIGWEEFFDVFDADRIVFRYSNDVIKGNEELSFNFVDRDKQAPLIEDETSLPEDNNMALENMYNNFDEDQLS